MAVCLRCLKKWHLSSNFSVRGIVTTICRYTETSGDTASAEHKTQSDGSESNDKEYEARQRILGASLQFVHQHGWTQKALTAGAESVGLPPVTHGLFPRGGAELVSYFYVSSNNKLSQLLSEETMRDEEEEEKKNTKALIRWAIEMRLRMIIPYIDKWPQAMGIMAMPGNAAEAWQNLAHLVDEIWYHAGDRSTDFNWYTKRVSLAAVYKTSEVYMLQDSSGDYTDTWRFMDRRIQDVGKIGKAVKECQQGSGVMKEGIFAATEIARNILGVGNRHR